MQRTRLPPATAECNQKKGMFEPDKAADAARRIRLTGSISPWTFLPFGLARSSRTPSQLHIRLLQSGRNHVHVSLRARIANLVRLLPINRFRLSSSWLLDRQLPDLLHHSNPFFLTRIPTLCIHRFSADLDGGIAQQNGHEPDFPSGEFV